MAVLKYKENGVWKNLSFVATQGDTVDLSGYVQKNELLDLIYPVGSIYMSVNSTSPATLFGGTWVQIEDTFLLASGSNYAAGSTGGEAAHTLTVDEMPSHSHSVPYMPGRDEGVEWVGQSGTAASQTRNTDINGGGAAHNNMPPYMAVYMWKRTA